VIERVIRVHLPGYATFVLVSRDGVVVEVTGDEAKTLLGRAEVDVARTLRNAGATFTDLINDRTVVKVARGYRSRDTQVPYGGKQ
jgi:hypothetical protein